MAVYAYLRVSTEDQDENSQRRGVDEFAARNGMKIDSYVVDHGQSGAKEFKDRNIGKLIKKLQKGDVVIASEISRIGRRLVLVLDFIKICTEKSVSFFTVKDRYSIADTLQSKVILTVMGLCAEIERDLIRQRTKEGLARALSEGKILGRPKGRKTSDEKLKLHSKELLIRELLSNGTSQRKIAVLLKVDRNTLARFIKEKK